MAERFFRLELNENELNVVWQTLMNGNVQGQQAAHVVTVSQKIQMAINAANEVKEPEVKKK